MLIWPSSCHSFTSQFRKSFPFYLENRSSERSKTTGLERSVFLVLSSLNCTVIHYSQLAAPETAESNDRPSSRKRWKTATTTPLRRSFSVRHYTDVQLSPHVHDLMNLINCAALLFSILSLRLNLNKLE